MKDLAYAFTICFATLGPLKTIPVFFLTTHGADRRTMLTMAARSTILATLIVLFVSLVASGTMMKWRVSIDALAIAGGIVLLITSVKTLTKFNLTEAPAPSEPIDTPESVRWMGRPVLSPLVIPAIIPPVGVVVILLFAGLTAGDLALQTQWLGLLLAIMAMNFTGMVFAGPIMRLVGLPVLQIIGWVFSALQAGLAIQTILNALRHLLKAATVAGLLGLMFLAAPLEASDWNHTGLLRVRDLTPFGILRLDFLPAHAVSAKPGTWALEANLSYQNTFVLSENVADYLRERGGGRRVKLTQADIDALFATGEEAYFVDLEVALLDLTAHYRFSPHWGAYLTVPVLSFRDGFLDSTIEGFHEEFGFDTAHRDLAVRNELQVVIAVEGARLAVLERPDDGVGDPVLGARYSLFAEPGRWNLILEGAVKVAWGDERAFLSSGKSDAGVQVSLQKFFDCQAFYLTASTVYFSGSDSPATPDLREIVPTLVLGWERRLTRRTNAILQLYASPSVVRDSALDELTAEKYLLSLGLQSRRGAWFYRFALTENLQNFSNTPDVGLTFSVARVVFGR